MLLTTTMKTKRALEAAVLLTAAPEALPELDVLRASLAQHKPPRAAPR